MPVNLASEFWVFLSDLPCHNTIIVRLLTNYYQKLPNVKRFIRKIKKAIPNMVRNVFFKLLILESTRGHLSNHPVVIVKGADVDYDFNHGNEKRDRPVSDVAQVKAQPGPQQGK